LRWGWAWRRRGGLGRLWACQCVISLRRRRGGGQIVGVLAGFPRCACADGTGRGGADAAGGWILPRDARIRSIVPVFSYIFVLCVKVCHVVPFKYKFWVKQPQNFIYKLISVR
jgi:hypothetical protein